jgi:alpha-galactosidase
MHQLLRLDGAKSCALIEFEVGSVPVWRHYGAKLEPTAFMAQWPAAALRRLPPGSMDRLHGVPLLPGFGNALPHEPALLCHRDGVNGIQEMLAVSVEAFSTAATKTLVIHLRDGTTQDAAALDATLTLAMHIASDVLSISTVLHNTGHSTVQLDRLAAGTVVLPASMQDIGSFHGQWAHEFQWQLANLGASGWHQENRHGRTSHESAPACFLMPTCADDHQGEVVAAHLGWSGNHYFSVNRTDDGAVVLQAGELFAPGEIRLQAGDTYATPSLHLTWSPCGMNRASSQLHQFARQQILQWPGRVMPARQVHLNTWEAVYFDHDATVLRELASQAAALGVERFVLDDGWFPNRPNDHSGLGDWWPDPSKYPQGLTPLITHVQALGMSFGLWVEPEMVNPDSDLFRRHPDWALQTRGRPLQFGRNQLVLNIAHPDVSNYLFEKLNTLLSQNAISYLKWDMNRDLAQAENAVGRLVYSQQVHALYALLARLRQAHTGVEIESCASGGGRMDLGILHHTQRFWTSDNNDALSRVMIQSGAARLFPLEVLGAHVGPAPAHSTGRSQSMDFRCAVACFGHMGVEADVRKLSPHDRTSLRHWIALYKTWRQVLHSGTFSQGRTVNGVWWLVQTPTRCLLGVFTLTAPAAQHHAPLKLPGLPSDGRWTVKLCGQAGQERARGDAQSPWLQALQSQGVVCTSAELGVVGLPLPNMNPESALVFSLQQL